MTYQPADDIRRSIALGVELLVADAGPADRAAHHILLAVTPTWDDDQRWAIAMEIAAAVKDALG